MDELELSGRRHISTKRAGKEHGYHSDYIGQLIRGGKVAGQKVGRSWYVDEESLRVYLGKAPASVVASTAPLEPPVPAVDQPTVMHVAKDVVAVTEKVDAPSLEQAGELTETESQHAVGLVAETLPEPESKEESIEVTNQEDSQPSAQEDFSPTENIYIEEERKVVLHTPVTSTLVEKPLKGLTYVEDHEPLLPHLEKEPVVVSAREQMSAAPVSSALPSLAHVLLTTVAVAVLVSVTALASVFLTTTIVVEEGKAASVFLSL